MTPSVNGQYLCATGPAFTTMEETWADGSNVGVFIRLLWNRVQPRPGTDGSRFDWSYLEREIDQAVRHGKVYSLAIKAGVDGTPDWIFTGATQSTANAAAARGGGRRAGGAGGAAGAGAATGAAPAATVGGGVVPLVLQDSGSGNDGRNGQG